MTSRAHMNGSANIYRTSQTVASQATTHANAQVGGDVAVCFAAQAETASQDAGGMGQQVEKAADLIFLGGTDVEVHDTVKLLDEPNEPLYLIKTKVPWRRFGILCTGQFISIPPGGTA